MDNNFLEKVGNILAQAKHNIKTAVNLSMVYTYYEIGRMIVEEECRGCGKCVARCGQNAVKIETDTKKAVIDNKKCVMCGYCAKICPECAIKII